MLVIYCFYLTYPSIILFYNRIVWWKGLLDTLEYLLTFNFKILDKFDCLHNYSKVHYIAKCTYIWIYVTKIELKYSIQPILASDNIFYKKTKKLQFLWINLFHRLVLGNLRQYSYICVCHTVYSLYMDYHIASMFNNI